MRHSVAGIVMAILAASFSAMASAPPAGEEPESVGSPDLRIIGWTIDDSLAGNADGGLHPGETAYLQIHISNQGNATARSVAGTLSEAADHPDVEIIDKFALWPDLPATGTPGTVTTSGGRREW